MMLVYANVIVHLNYILQHATIKHMDICVKPMLRCRHIYVYTQA